MKNTSLTFCERVQALANALLRDESGQDLIEYALVIAVIALGATASMSSLAASFSTAMSRIGSKMATYTS
jgi:pilus assembly protein Flp/PilA